MEFIAARSASEMGMKAWLHFMGMTLGVGPLWPAAPGAGAAAGGASAVIIWAE